MGRGRTGEAKVPSGAPDGTFASPVRPLPITHSHGWSPEAPPLVGGPGGQSPLAGFGAEPRPSFVRPLALPRTGHAALPATPARQSPGLALANAAICSGLAAFWYFACQSLYGMP